MGIAVLGPLELDGTTSTLGLRDRVVLEALAVRPGAVVRAESLAEAIWGETPPPSWPKVVQGCVSRLRKTLGGDLIETAEHGYRLRVHVDHVDHLRFERLVGRARELLDARRARAGRVPPSGGPGPVAGRALHRAERVGAGAHRARTPGRDASRRRGAARRGAPAVRRPRRRARPCRAPRARGTIPRATVGSAGAGSVPGGPPTRGARYPAPGARGHGQRARPGPEPRPDGARAGHPAAGPLARRAGRTPPAQRRSVPTRGWSPTTSATQGPSSVGRRRSRPVSATSTEPEPSPSSGRRGAGSRRSPGPASRPRWSGTVAGCGS